MLILLGIVIFIISFVIALVSMIREQRAIESRQKSADDSVGGEQKSDLEPSEADMPQAQRVDILKSRIEELEAQEELQQQKQGRGSQIAGGSSEPEEQLMQGGVRGEENQSVTGQGPLESKGVPSQKPVGGILGSDDRLPVGMSGTILVQELVKKRQGQR